MAAAALSPYTACGWLVTTGGTTFGSQLSRSAIRTVGGSLASSAGGSAWTSRVSFEKRKKVVFSNLAMSVTAHRRTSEARFLVGRWFVCGTGAFEL